MFRWPAVVVAVRPIQDRDSGVVIPPGTRLRVLGAAGCLYRLELLDHVPGVQPPGRGYIGVIVRGVRRGDVELADVEP